MASEFLTLTESFHFKQCVSGPTHIRGHTLDLVFSLGLNIDQLSVMDLNVSDHSCIFFNLSSNVECLPCNPALQRRIISQTKSEKFSESFDPSSFMDCSDAESFLQSFNIHCLSVLNNVAPLKSKSTFPKNPCPWVNEEIMSFRRKCRKVERLWKSTSLEVHRLHLKELITLLNVMIKQARSTYFANLVTLNKKNPKVLFDTISKIVSPLAPQVPVHSKSDCNRFLHAFVNKVQDIRATINPSLETISYGSASSYSWDSFSPVTCEDIKGLLSKVKPSSSPLDVLPTALLLNVFDLVGPYVVKLINLSLLTGSVPSHFKQAVVSPILKKPNLDSSEPTNYRPISKLPFLSKILERVVAGQLTSYLDGKDLFDKFQSGFRKCHSTETALLKVSNDILMAADSGQYTVLILLDLSSAFDTLDHTVLIHRLCNEMGFSGSVLKWFTSYLSDRSFCVSMNNILSEMTPLSYGVPQGSVLGPILFLLYISPLGEIIRNFNNVSYHFYADDIQLYCSFKEPELGKLNDLLECLSCIKTWLYNNYLQLNIKKTETLIIAPEQKIPQIKQYLCSLDSSVQLSLRNLGVLFDQSLSLDGHSRQLVRNCFYHLRNISKLRKILPKATMEMIIHTFISSRLDYCNSLFTCFNNVSLNRLQLVQNAAARLLTGTNRRAHITPILFTLHWLPVKFRINYKILVLTFRALHGQTPQYIADMLTPYSSFRTLRSSGQNLLIVPKTRLKTRGDRSFQAVAPKLWNALPLSLRVVDSVDSFKKQLKTLLFSQAFS